MNRGCLRLLKLALRDLVNPNISSPRRTEPKKKLLKAREFNIFKNFNENERYEPN